jgi:predicted nuclease of predicted toxin-antitoxin system
VRLLLDTCISGLAKDELLASGHDVAWTAEWPEDPGDEVILAHAYQERRVLVTLDKDFGELAVLRGLPHCGILRLVDFRASQQGTACVLILEKHGSDLAAGAIVTAEPGLLRIRRPQAASG